ncbi:MAG: Arc family DNA-binding protein [Hyphomicrobiaceae bacterium]|nr:Arc family DNA-binding protein [Hyphomicrobiaceae bacterium]
MRRAIKCKRIIDGKTYNTETATQLAGWDDDNREYGPYDTGRFLFQTRPGAFFLYSYCDGMGEDDFEKIEPLTPEQARKWLEENQSSNVDLIEQLFGEMPEAGSGEVKYTLRMPESLRDRLTARARANEQSLNAWIIRCLESCASADATETEIPPMTGLKGNRRMGYRTK